MATDFADFEAADLPAYLNGMYTKLRERGLSEKEAVAVMSKHLYTRSPAAASAAASGAGEGVARSRRLNAEVCFTIRIVIETIAEYVGAVQDVINGIIEAVLSAFGIEIPSIPFPDLSDLLPDFPDLSFPFDIDINNPFAVPFAYIERVISMVFDCWEMAKTACDANQNQALQCPLLMPDRRL